MSLLDCLKMEIEVLHVRAETKHVIKKCRLGHCSAHKIPILTYLEE